MGALKEIDFNGIWHHGAEAHTVSGGGTNLFVQQTNPNMTEPGIWVELNPNGTVKTFWVENGA
jgi:hypothetical protein